MKTLYLRNVPDDVVSRLELMADRERMSVSALAVRELAHASRRVDAPALLGALPDLGVGTELLVEDLEAGRNER